MPLALLVLADLYGAVLIPSNSISARVDRTSDLSVPLALLVLAGLYRAVATPNEMTWVAPTHEAFGRSFQCSYQRRRKRLFAPVDTFISLSKTTRCSHLYLDLLEQACCVIALVIGK